MNDYVPKWVWFSLGALFLLFCVVCFGPRFLKSIDTTPAIQQTNAVAVAAAAETNNLVPSGTNGLTIVNDVGGTVSFQQSSSRTSAPVVPENPYLNKK